MKNNEIIISNLSIPDQWFHGVGQLGIEVPKPKNSDNGNQLENMEKIRIDELVRQDKTEQAWVDIPQPVLEEYIRAGRPTRLTRAVNLEQYLGCSSKLYFKREDLLPTHSFKLNTAIAQAYYAAQQNIGELVTETGAGQWGSALAYACRNYDITCRIFWAKVSKEQKELRTSMAELYGAKIYASPSRFTEAGRQIRRINTSGSIGSGISEAVSYALAHKETRYVSGSVHPHVLLHQSIIGLETKLQLEKAGIEADTFVACIGGGSNLGGFMMPFLSDSDYRHAQFCAAESAAAPRFTKGEYRYDHSDPLGLTPMTCSYTLGMDFVPPPVHSGGLRQHNSSAILGALYRNRLLDVQAYDQREIFEAGRLLAKCEGILPAPESCHAVKAAIDAAKTAEKQGKTKTIVVCLSGSGYYDLRGYKEVLRF